MVRAYVGIGSNIDPERHVPGALRDLRSRFGPLTVSPVYRSPAIGFEGRDFHNQVVGLDTELPPQEMVTVLREIEVAHGRPAAHEKLASRTLDLDLLLYGDQVLHEGRLRLPRSDVTQFAHVLRPLSEIAPDERHPLLGHSYAEMWSVFDDREQPLTPVVLTGVSGEGD